MNTIDGIDNLDSNYLITVFCSLLKLLPKQIRFGSVIIGFKQFMSSEIVTHKMCRVHKIANVIYVCT